MASNPNRSRDLLEFNIMRVSVQPHLDVYSTFRALDEAARVWLVANTPPHAGWFGPEVAVPQSDVATLRNKFVDAGGQLN